MVSVSQMTFFNNSNYRINSAQICPKKDCISLKIIMFLDISCKLLTLSVILGHEVCEIVRNPDVLCLLTNRWLVLEGKEKEQSRLLIIVEKKLLQWYP